MKELKKEKKKVAHKQTNIQRNKDRKTHTKKDTIKEVNTSERKKDRCLLFIVRKIHQNKLMQVVNIKMHTKIIHNSSYNIPSEVCLLTSKLQCRFKTNNVASQNVVRVSVWSLRI